MTDQSGSNSQWTRRSTLIGGSALLLGFSPAAPAIARSRPVGVRRLAFFNLHTHEKVDVDYFADGRYISDGVQALDHFMRDVRDGKSFRMKRDLYDLLFDLHTRMRTNEPFHLISGYRSPGTNAWLRSIGRGVAKRSLHMSGLACDIRVPGRSTGQVWRAARGLQRGGVGLYTRSKFVHIDIGPVRYWGS
ncbi:MAG: DUF882 domain-containing protein [Alphaproteobacteria bacterium]|nr:DUF882 domain-containing protein [Alphaproteobacteria bacterium]